MLPFSKYALISQNRLLPLIEYCCNIWNKTRPPQPIFGEIGNQTYAAGPNGFPYRNQACFFLIRIQRIHLEKTENIFANVRLSAVTFMIACYRRTGLTYQERFVGIAGGNIFFSNADRKKFVISIILKVLAFLVHDRGT